MSSRKDVSVTTLKQTATTPSLTQSRHTNDLLRAMKHWAVKWVTGVCLVAGTMGCSKSDPTFSMLNTNQEFKQADAQINNKIDILWVVDNSYSMAPLQQNLINNFNSFIANFQSKGFDFKMAVITSDAYLAATNYRNDPSFARFRDGASGSHTGYFTITPTTPNLHETFMINANQGASGSGDERVFQSITEALNNSLNAGFLRPDAFHAVIILSDEDDFSDASRPEGSWLSGGIADKDYTNPNLWTVDSFIAQLDSLTASTAGKRKYNVSAITVLDDACLATHKADAASSVKGTRYIELANKTDGILGSVCDASYASSLEFIQQRIVELSTQFSLTRIPKPETIAVIVDGSRVAQDPNNGWTYEPTTNSIKFHGTAVPSASSKISISFDPAAML